MVTSSERQELDKICRKFLRSLGEISDDDLIHYKLLTSNNIVYLVPDEALEMSVVMMCIDEEEAKRIHNVVLDILEEIKIESFDA